MSYMFSDKNNFCISTITDDQFIYGTSVLLHSFQKNNKWFNGDIIIFYDELSTDSIKLLKIFENIRLVKISKKLRSCLNNLVTKYPQYKNSFKRFYSTEIFRLSDYEKILFLDSDMIVLKDVSEILLFNSDFLACSDACEYFGEVRDRASFLKIKVEDPDKENCFLKSFNSGLLLIPNKYLNKKVYNDLINLTIHTKWENLKMPHTDQYIYNHYFENDVNYLPSEYNVIVPKAEKILKSSGIKMDDIKILHFVGHKPWNLRSNFISIQNKLTQLKYIQLWYKEYFDFLKNSHLASIFS